MRASRSRVGSFRTSSPSTTPAVAVGGVLAQADVGDHEQVAAGGADRAHGLLHDAVLRVPSRAHRVLGLGQAEQDHARDAQGLDLARLPRRLVGGEVEAARAARRSPAAAPCPGATKRG